MNGHKSNKIASENKLKWRSTEKKQNIQSSSTSSFSWFNKEKKKIRRIVIAWFFFFYLFYDRKVERWEEIMGREKKSNTRQPTFTANSQIKIFKNGIFCCCYSLALYFLSLSLALYSMKDYTKHKHGIQNVYFGNILRAAFFCTWSISSATTLFQWPFIAILESMILEFKISYMIWGL